MNDGDNSYYIDDLMSLIVDHLEQCSTDFIVEVANKVLESADVSYDGDSFFSVKWND